MTQSVQQDTVHQDTKPTLPTAAKMDLVKYFIVRIVLFLVLTLVIQSAAIVIGIPQFPILFSAVLAILVALPLSMIIFRNLRNRVTYQMAVWDKGRQEYKRKLAKQLEERF